MQHFPSNCCAKGRNVCCCTTPRVQDLARSPLARSVRISRAKIDSSMSLAISRIDHSRDHCEIQEKFEVSLLAIKIFENCPPKILKTGRLWRRAPNFPKPRSPVRLGEIFAQTGAQPQHTPRGQQLLLPAALQAEKCAGAAAPGVSCSGRNQCSITDPYTCRLGVQASPSVLQHGFVSAGIRSR